MPNYRDAKYAFDTPIARDTAPGAERFDTVEKLQRALESLDAMPIVGPGEKKPKGEWFLYRRKADKGRTKERIYLYRPDGTRISTRVDTDALDWRTEARDQARRIVEEEMARAETRQAPRDAKVCDLLGAFLDAARGRHASGQIKPGTLKSYRGVVQRLGAFFGDAALDRVGPETPARYQAWADRRGYSYSTSVDDLSLLRRALNEALTLARAPVRVWFAMPQRRPEPKRPFAPWELDRLLLAALGYRFRDPHTLEMVVDPETGKERPFRHSPEVIAARAPYYVAILIAVQTGTRKQAICELSWVDLGFPWIDLERGILHREGRKQLGQFAVKRRGIARLPPALVDALLPIAQADIENGCLWVIHDAHGARLTTLPWDVWQDILRDACVEPRKFHALKDTAVDIANHSGVPIGVQAQYFQTTARTLTMWYGSDADVGLQVDLAEAMGTQEDWRRRHAAEARRIAVAAQARADKAAKLSRGRKALPPPGAAPREAVPEEALAVAAGHDGSGAVQAVLAEAARDFAEVRDEAAKAIPRRAVTRARRVVEPWPGRPPGRRGRRPRYRD